MPSSPTLLQSFVAGQAERLVGDKTFDSDPLDWFLLKVSMFVIASALDKAFI